MRNRTEVPIGTNVCIETWSQDACGNWVREAVQWHHNLVTQAGFNMVRDFLANLAPSGLRYFALGTGVAVPTPTDTALGAELLRDIFTGYTIGTGVLTFTYFLGTTIANGNTLSEIGLFTTVTGGILFARALLSPVIVKTVSRQVTFTWFLGINAGDLVVTINRFVGYVVTLGGDPVLPSTAIAYPTGGTVDKLVPSSEVWFLLPSDLPSGTFALQAMMKVNNALGQGTIALFNLDDAPDTVIPGSQVSGTVGQQTGELITSTAMSLLGPVTAKRWGVKVKSNNVAYGVSVWGLRIVQLS
jgi:hypothetical protein